MTARKLALLLLLCPVLTLAQRNIGARAGTISARAGAVRLLQGSASLDGQRLRIRRGIDPPPQMRKGQRLHVDSGKVEVLLGPGAEVTLNEGATLRMQESLLSDVQLILDQGSALVKVDQIFKGGRLRMVYGDAAAEMASIGWYRFDAEPKLLRVYKGEAGVVKADSLVKAKKGQSVDFAALAISTFNLKTPDVLIAFELQRNQQFEARQRRAMEDGSVQQARRKELEDERAEIEKARQEVQMPVPLPPDHPQ